MTHRHDWKENGLDTHKGEYWYKCEKCGARDWIASYGSMNQLMPQYCLFENKWQAVVDDMLTVFHEVASDDPRESINRLINWHVQIALDPSVSSDAKALVDKGINQERDRILALIDKALLE